MAPNDNVDVHQGFGARWTLSVMVPDLEWVAVPYHDDDPGDCFLISKFPVTVAQFSLFVDARGYQRQDLWSQRGWQWLAQNGFSQPAYWDHPDYRAPSLPVTGLSFWEADAYARFAGAFLPNEQEWFAAGSNQGTTRYPWGDEHDDAGPRRANLTFFGALGDRGLRPVDAFSAGQSKAGVWDLLGNVSEWCLPSNGRVLQAEAKTAVLRGGCFWHTPVAVDATFFDTVTLNTRDNQTGIRLVRRSQGERRRSESPSSLKEPAKRVHRRIRRPSAPFRQEGLPTDLTRDTWRLRITGNVAEPIELSLDQLMNAFPRTELNGMFVCVCRWGALNRFAGVSLKDLVERAKVTVPVDGLYLRQTSVPGATGRAYESWISVAEALKHDALLAYEMDGQPLTMDLGWPLRLIDLHLFAYKAVKCLAELCFTNERGVGWWEQECQYDPGGVIQPGVITVVGEASYRRTLDGSGCVPLTAEERSALTSPRSQGDGNAP